ncbi:MAG: hypothetical protein ACYC5O_17925 [Anaerolineae bacterium]
MVDMQQNLLLAMARRGTFGRGITDFATRALSGYFRNRDILQSIPDSIQWSLLYRLSLVNATPWTAQALADVLTLYRRAGEEAEVCSLSICADWSAQIRNGEGLLVSDMKLAMDTDRMLMPDKALIAFRRIGTMVESTIAPILRELLGQLLLESGKGYSLPRLADKKLGTVVDDLFQDPRVPRCLLRPQPWEVPISQWRNIAQHGTWQVRADTVECTYGRPPSMRTVRLSAEDLSLVEETLVTIWLVLGTARSLYLLDRDPPALEHIVRQPGEERDDFRMGEYARAVASHGFEIMALDLSEKEAKVVFRDVTADDPEARKLHAISFAYHLCTYSRRPQARALFAAVDGAPCYEVTVQERDCRLVEAGDWEALLPHLEVKDHRTGTTYHGA